jgi:hypothetical protein
MNPNKQNNAVKSDRPDTPMQGSTSQKEKAFDQKSTGSQKDSSRGNAPETDHKIVPGRDDASRSKKLV